MTKTIPDVLTEGAEKLQQYPLTRDVKIMEVCGTHTTEFFRSGVKDIFPRRLRLVDGPGCPVCVTTNDYLDRAIEIARNNPVILTTFGDMMRVPSSYSSLLKENARLDIRVLYSPLDALSIAVENPDKEVVFLSVGFETTIPTEAMAVKRASELGLKNFSLLTGNKLTPPAVKALLDSGEVAIDGFILPGHVSAITGIAPWRFIADDYGKPCVVAGFESKHLILGTLMLLNLIIENRCDVLNEYREVVTEEGNQRAQELIREIFEPCTAQWRGIGPIPHSGMRLKTRYRDYCAKEKFPVTLPPTVEPKGCRCGEVLRGMILPTDCPLFGKNCTPGSPVGACMVSSEGSCAAYYKYQGFE